MKSGVFFHSLPLMGIDGDRRYRAQEAIAFFTGYGKEPVWCNINRSL
ncbi:MAG: hypothetical protein EBE86_015155 [Hormoscilla sp. GUM202]|nr:hypothetical protein [Hormoscilla sp. GUM202]